MNKQAFSTSAYSGPLNPNIASGASFQPPRRAPQLQSAIQKTAELWPGFFDEMLKYAADASVGGGVNIGQWWEQVGGPFLAKGGDHAEFEQMMNQAGLPPGVQKKFMNVAKTQYASNKAPKFRPEQSSWSGPGPEPPNSNYQGRSRGHAAPPTAGEIFGEIAGDFKKNPMQWAPGLGALAGVVGAAHLNSEKEETAQAPSALRGRVGAHLMTTVPLGLIGHGLGHALAPGSSAAPWVGAGLGAITGGLMGEAAHAHQPQLARSTVNRALGPSRTDEQREKSLGRFESAARDTTSKAVRSVANVGTLPALAMAGVAGPRAFGTTAGTLASIAQGGGLVEQYRKRLTHQMAQEKMDKAAAGAPTRGNFMMASDVPPFKAPRLDRAIQKEGDMLPDYVTYGPGDFKKSKYAMPTEELSAFVADLLKEAEVSPAVTWSGGGGNPHRMASDIPAFRAPRLDRAIQKEGSPSSQLHQSQSVGAPKASAPPGPSIADIAKPKGAGFGTGIAGAFKGSIGGTAPVGLK